MNKTTHTSAKEVTHNWYEIDATNIPLGRLSVTIAKHLMGKVTPEYAANLDMGNFVIITNAGAVKLTGKKESYLDIRHYTGHPSGLRKERVDLLMKNNPAKVIETAVRGMLPNTKKRDTYMSRLYIYTEATHPHTAQKPTKISV